MGGASLKLRLVQVSDVVAGCTVVGAETGARPPRFASLVPEGAASIALIPGSRAPIAATADSRSTTTIAIAAATRRHPRGSASIVSGRPSLYLRDCSVPPREVPDSGGGGWDRDPGR